MKKRFMKVIAVSMAAMLSLCACTSTGNGAGSDDGVTGISTEAIGNETSNGASTDSSSETTVDTGFPVTLVSHKITATQDDKTLAEGYYEEIILSEEYKAKYPKLAEYLSALNGNSNYGMPEEVSQYAAWALEDTYNEGAQYYSDSGFEVYRFDDRLLSIIEHVGDYSGGAHPNHFSGPINLDPVTGDTVRLDQVLNDSSLLPDGIRTELEKKYPGIMEEVDSFYYQGEGEDPDQFKQKLIDDSYTWSVTAEGLYIIFSPYEIASYAAGDLEITLSTSDYPNLIQDAYKLSEAQDMTKIVTTIEGDPITVAPKEEEPTPDSVSISNPTWKKYQAEGITAGTDHITLTKTKEDKTDWIDETVWAEKNGFELEFLAHEDENYFYSGANEIDFINTYQELQIYDTNMEKMYYNLNLNELCNGPDYEEERYSGTSQWIRYATIVDNILYAELGHMGYASEESWSSYIVAINLDTNELLFRSEPLVANGENFKIVGDTIICGYGFTSEPDYIYLLDRFTGEKYETIPINSAASQFHIEGDTLYVCTYNTAYEFTISH